MDFSLQNQPPRQPSAVAGSTPFRPVGLVSFGGKKADSADLKNSLPDWAQGVKPPPVTYQDFENAMMDAARLLYEEPEPEPDNPLPRKGLRSRIPRPPTAGLDQAFRLLRLQRKLAALQNKKSKAYLPAEARSRIRRYKLNPRNWFKMLFDRKAYRRELVCLEGPVAIKGKQAEVENILRNEKTLRATLKRLNDPEKMNTLPLPFPANKVLPWVMRRAINNQLDTLATYRPLLNRIPILPESTFKDELARLAEAYNRKHPANRLKEGFQPVAAGSIGQVFAAETERGDRLIFKVRRPDARKQFLEASRPYLYYMNLLLKGTDAQTRPSVIAEANGQYEYLQMESDFVQEAANLKHLKAEADRLGIRAFEIPQALFATEDGMVLPYVGERDLSDADPDTQHRIKAAMGPDMLMLYLLSNAKMLDPHSGNVRIGADKDTKPFVIDAGRQANLDPEVHRRFLNLLTAMYAAKQPESPLFFEDETHPLESLRVRAALNELLEGEPPEDGQLAESTLKGLFRLSPDALTTRPGLAMIQKMMAEYGMAGESEDLNDMPLTLLNAWLNYGVFNREKDHIKLAGMIPTTMSRQDMKIMLKKTLGFLAPGITAGAKTDGVALIGQLIDHPERFLEAFGNGKLLGDYRLGELGYLAAEILAASPDVADEPEKQPQPRPDFLMAQYNQVLAHVGSDEKLLKRLATAYGQSQTLKQMARRLADTLTTGSGKPFTADERRRLEANLVEALSNDFHSAFITSKKIDPGL